MWKSYGVHRAANLVRLAGKEYSAVANSEGALLLLVLFVNLLRLYVSEAFNTRRVFWQLLTVTGQVCIVSALAFVWEAATSSAGAT